MSLVEVGARLLRTCMGLLAASRAGARIATMPGITREMFFTGAVASSSPDTPPVGCGGTGRSPV